MSVSPKDNPSRRKLRPFPPAPDQNGEQQPQPILCTSGDQIRKQKPRWFLPGWVPFPSIFVIGGPGEVGKSTLAAAFVAAWTGGPRLRGQSRWKPSDVLIFSAEENVAARTVRKLEAAGAELSRVHFPGLDRNGVVSWEPDLTGDLGELEALIRETGATLVVIDPFAAYVGQGQLDLNSQQQARRVLKTIKDLCDKCGCCVLLIMHTNKSQTGRVIDRLFGSGALSQAPRAVVLVGLHPRLKDRRVMTRGKVNDAEPVPARTFDLVDKGGVQAVVWREEEEMRPEDMASMPAEPGQRSLAETARQLLRQRIGNGWVSSVELLAEARTVGISESTLATARAQLKVQTRRVGGVGAKGHWECGPPLGGWLPER